MRVNVYIKEYKTKTNEVRYLLIVREKGRKDHNIGLGPVSKKVAKERRVQLLNDLLLGEYKREPEVYLYFGEFVKKFFIDFANGMRSAGTIDHYFYVLKPLVKRFNNLKLNQIKRHDIERYIAERKVSNRTKNIILSVLRVLFSKAVEWNYLNTSPAKDIKRVPEFNKGSRSLTPLELESLWPSLNPWQRSIITLMVNSGMRPGELSNLKWKDIDWEANKLAIVTDKTRRTKSGKTRYIPMNAALREELLFLKKFLPVLTGRGVHPRTDGQMEYVLCRPDGSPVRNFRKAVRNALDHVKISGVTPHGLRKTFCSLLARAKVHPRVAQELMGHSDINLTMKVYTEIDDGQMRAAVETLPVIPGVEGNRLRLVSSEKKCGSIME